MITFKSIIWKHWIALVFALFIGFVYVSPHVIFVNSLGADYKGIYMSRSYDEDTYYSAVRQVYDGKSSTDNPYLPEYKDKSIVSAYKFLETLVGAAGKFFGLSISNLAILSKFIFPPVIFLVIYLFVMLLFKNKPTALLTGTFILLGHELAPLNTHSAIQTFLFNSPFQSFLFFNRPINPQISAIFFFGTLCLIALFWEHPESKKYAILSGLAVGFLSYIYFYFWNFSMILLGVILLYAILARNKILLKNIFLAIFSSLVVSLPFIFNVISALKSGGQAIQKNYLLTHRFINEKVILLPLIFFALIYIWNYFSKKYNLSKWIFTFLNDNKFVFLFLLVITGFIASNQQIIHGYEIQQQHYHFMTNIPVFIIVISAFFVAFVEKYFRRVSLILISLVMLVVVVHGVSVQTASYRYWSPIFKQYQDYASVFDWLNKNTKVDDVVYSNTTISEFVPMYTHDSVYGSLHASVYPVPTERLAHNYFTLMYLRGVSANQAKDYLYTPKNRDEFGQLVFEGQYWRSVCGSFGCFPDLTLDKYVADYIAFTKNTFESNLKKYKVDYILWDRKEDLEWGIDKLPFVKEVTRSKNVSVYSVL